MLKMVEVVGGSAAGYSEAAQAAVEHVAAAGAKVHFFTVVEQRGAVRNGKVEFQAVVKVAVEAQAVGH